MREAMTIEQHPAVTGRLNHAAYLPPAVTVNGAPVPLATATIDPDAAWFQIFNDPVGAHLIHPDGREVVGYAAAVAAFPHGDIADAERSGWIVIALPALYVSVLRLGHTAVTLPGRFADYPAALAAGANEFHIDPTALTATPL